MDAHAVVCPVDQHTITLKDVTEALAVTRSSAQRGRAGAYVLHANGHND